MDSPERSLTITAAEVQGSPLFNFLCSLSPIKPVKSVHVAQTFSDLTFPPPPAVFVSPRGDAHATRCQSKSRAELASAGSGSSVNGQGEDQQLCLNLVQRGQISENTKRTKDRQEKDRSSASPCSSPSKLIEEYLAEPIELEVHTVGSSCSSAVSNVCGMKASSLEEMHIVEEVDDCKLIIKEEAIAPSGGSCVYSKYEVTDMGGVANLGQKRTCSYVAGLEDNQSMVSAKETSSVIVHPNSQGSGNDEEGLENDQEASDFIFLLSEGADKLPIQINRWQNHASSEFSMEHMTGYLATMREIVNEGAHETGIDCMSTHATTIIAGDKRPEVSGTCKQEIEPETGDDQQGGASFRQGSAPPQRGVRRRCLDFEASEAQWESKNNISTLKSLGSSSDNSSLSAASCGPDASIPVSILRARAAATSDATNSESPEVKEDCKQSCSKTEEKNCTKVSWANSRTLRLSRCSSVKNAECMPAKPDNQLACATRPTGTSPVPVGMPSGIGLHLNSLTGIIPFSQSSKENEVVGCSSVSTKSVNSLLGAASLSGLQESPSENYENCLPANSFGNNLQVGSTASFRKGLVVSLVEKTRMDEHEVRSQDSDQVVSTTKSMTCFRSITMGIKQLEEKSSPSELEKKPSPLGRKRVLLQDFPCHLDLDCPEDTDQSLRSPKKKRKSATAAEKSGDGCKRCNCKKSKCLKLYCECFAAGVYCVDSCTCHDCFNKPEFEETVLETRQQIESRNPLAFAPKIIRAAESSPTNGEECGDTSASARHKRGCNCKKSQCLKKYCECYQAGVGCSDGCRCESCKNVFGRKEGSEESEDKDPPAQMDKETGEELIDASDFHIGLLCASQQQNSDLSPITPSFQNTGQNRSAIKLRSASKKGSLSEELHSPTFSMSSARLPKSPSRFLRSSRGTQNGSITASTGMHFTKTAGSPISTPKMLRIGQFSPRWDGLGDICTLTPLPQAPLRPTPASASITEGPDSSPPFNGQQPNEITSSGKGSVKTSSKFPRGSSPISMHPVSRSLVSSHHFQTPGNVQRTPATPIFSSPVCITRNKSAYEDSDVFDPQFEGSIEDDNTPEFLKDSETACSPARILKTSSPKQKRVSPPKHQGLREASNRGIHTPGLRSNRKFILQSIPSVPPTPFVAIRDASRNQG